MEEATTYLRKYIQKDTCVVVAVSGGADSMSLLHLLVTYRREANIKIVCAHVNHKVREESDSEENFVKNYCLEHEVLFEKCVLNQYSGKNFENDAHHQRYAFFETLIQKYNASFLLTAHHGDDLIETVLLKMIRGSSLKGYKGFEIYQKRKTYCILRPLIHETKESILRYNEKNKIAYVNDLSNFEDIHTRNRIRKYILPLLKRENKNVHEKFIKWNREVSENEAYIARMIQKEMGKVYIDGAIQIDSFSIIDSYLQKKIIESILEDLYKNQMEKIMDKHIFLLLELSKKNSGKQVHLPNKLVAIKNGNVISFLREKQKDSYFIELQEKVELPNGHVIEKRKEEKENSNFICRLNKNDIVFPIYVRTREAGDRMYIKHMKGSKKINDIFIECKVPVQKRDTYPIVVDSQGEILWLPGLKKSKFDIEKDKKCDIILWYN